MVQGRYAYKYVNTGNSEYLNKLFEKSAQGKALYNYFLG